MEEKRTPRRILFPAIFSVLLLVAGFIGGVTVSAKGMENVFPLSVLGLDATPPEDVDLSTFWKAWNVLEAKYVATASSTLPTAEERVYGAIKGLAQSYGDPYTQFLPPAETEVFEADISGDFEGVGMEIGMRNGVLTVIAPLKGTPAAEAGLQSGDAIIAIDGEGTDQLSTDAAVQRIRGERGTEIVFTILRDGTILDISVTRDVIQIPVIDTTLRDDGIFVIELYSFTANAPRLFQEALSEFSQSGSEDLILDLRGNPGGYLGGAVSVASWFLPEGTPIVIEDYGKEKDDVHRSRGYATIGNGADVVVLINGGSASASEIVAGALQDHGVATLVGQPSFGKGSVQELVKPTVKTALKVTVARWLTPNGRSISEGGLEPDILVEFNPEEEVDAQLEEAATILRNK